LLRRVLAAGRNTKYALSADNAHGFHSSASRKMRFVQFQSSNGGPQRLGVQLSLGGDIIDVSGVNSSIPNSLVKFLALGPAYLEKAKRLTFVCIILIDLIDIHCTFLLNFRQLKL